MSLTIFSAQDEIMVLDAFSEWMKNNTNLGVESIKKYKGAVRTVSNEMLEEKIIHKSILEMNRTEYDIAMNNIFSNEAFIAKNVRGDNMYSNSLKRFRLFLHECKEEDNKEKEIENEIIESTDIGLTERQTIVRARVGQGDFRRRVIEKYDGKCVVTGIDKSSILIASHIKPWAVCNNVERIDVENGLLLCPNIDKIFDIGLLTFSKNGQMLISPYVGENNMNRLGISEKMTVDLRATDELWRYLEYHRDVVFVK